MLTTLSGMSRLRPHYLPETQELFDVLLNATSTAEANLALDLMSETVPEKSLVTAVNLREVLKNLPASPFSMRVDEEMLVRTAGLTRDIAVFSKVLPDDIELAVTTAGNLVLDVIVKVDGKKHFWSPIPITDEYVSAPVLKLVIASDHLLDAVIELVKAMGLVFNPRFYFSLEDFRLENAAEVVRELDSLFSPQKNPLLFNWSEDLFR